jgi:hypothetical protein
MNDIGLLLGINYIIGVVLCAIFEIVTAKAQMQKTTVIELTTYLFVSMMGLLLVIPLILLLYSTVYRTHKFAKFLSKGFKIW